MSASAFLSLFENDPARAARDHAAYRWAPRHSHAWTPEQRAAYDQEYDTARGEPANTSYYILVTPPRVVKASPHFYKQSGQTPEIAERIVRELQQSDAGKLEGMRSTYQIMDYRQARQAAAAMGIAFA